MKQEIITKDTIIGEKSFYPDSYIGDENNPFLKKETKLKVNETSQIVFFGKYPNNKEQIMRISKEGFFWHGEKVEDKENIYERFNQWLKDWNY